MLCNLRRPSHGALAMIWHVHQTALYRSIENQQVRMQPLNLG